MRRIDHRIVSMTRGWLKRRRAAAAAAAAAPPAAAPASPPEAEAELPVGEPPAEDPDEHGS